MEKTIFAQVRQFLFLITCVLILPFSIRTVFSFHANKCILNRDRKLKKETQRKEKKVEYEEKNLRWTNGENEYSKQLSKQKMNLICWDRSRVLCKSRRIYWMWIFKFRVKFLSWWSNLCFQLICFNNFYWFMSIQQNIHQRWFSWGRGYLDCQGWRRNL
jgi:hypothetical protein